MKKKTKKWAGGIGVLLAVIVGSQFLFSYYARLVHRERHGMYMLEIYQYPRERGVAMPGDGGNPDVSGFVLLYGNWRLRRVRVEHFNKYEDKIWWGKESVRIGSLVVLEF